jgi:acetoin utilization deacetylase AcuC-like enzyme
MAPTQGYNALDPDTIMNPFTLPAALHAAGAIIAAVDDTFAQRTQKSFCLVRPPGHHAEPDVAMGFCFFNNVAIGVKHAMAKYNCQRIAIIDFDVHHGNGTHTTFMNEPRVFFWSSFQHPFYPGVSLTNVSPNIHLCPLNAGTNSAQYRGIITKELLPALEEFKPEIIFISAGFDAHQSDPLANIQLTTEDYAFITHVLCKVADKTAQGRIISTLEGGYNLPALGASAAAHVGAMLEPS